MKKISIEIVPPLIITDPPRPDEMKLDISGMTGTEAVLLLLSCAAQIAAKELPPIIAALKATEQHFNPHGQIPGKA